MEIVQQANYQISRSGNTFGPYPGSQLLQMANSGQLFLTDLLWTEGMPQWVAASEFSQVKSILGSQVVSQGQAHPFSEASVPGVSPQAAQPVGPPQNSNSLSQVPRRPRQSRIVARQRKGASFGLFMLSLFVFFGVLFGPSLLMVTVVEKGSGEPRVSIFESYLNSELAANAVVQWGLVVLLFAGLLFFPILSLIYLYRGWSYIQDVPTVTTSPGKAVGLMLIPFFNIIWIFFAYPGWAKNYNIRRNLSHSQSAPMVSETLFLLYCIFAVLGFPLLFPFMMFQMCRGINYLSGAPQIKNSHL